MSKIDLDITNLPDTTVSVKEKFGFESKMVVPAYSAATEHVPDFDPDYLFDQQTTLAIAMITASGDQASPRITGAVNVSATPTQNTSSSR